MSRSYKAPYDGVAYGPYRRFAKNLMNRKARRVPAEADVFPKKGNRFKDLFVDTWEIRDYWKRYSFPQFLERAHAEHCRAVENAAGRYKDYWARRPEDTLPVNRQQAFIQWRKLMCSK